MTNQPKIIVTPKRAMRDAPLEIELIDFPPHKEVTVKAVSIDHKDITWKAEAIYKTNSKGRLYLNKQAPKDGGYCSKDPMELIWTMTPDSKKVESPHFMIRRDQRPWTISFEAWMEGSKVSSESVARLAFADGSKRIEVEENGLMGVLYLPSGEGPFPAITIVSGSGGGCLEIAAASYASHGYATLALAYFNYKSLPEYLYEIPLEYFEKSIHYLQSRKDIDGKRLAINGASRGGELALLLGSLCPQYKAVIAQVPSGIVWGGIGGDDSDESRPAWTYKGKPIPVMGIPYDSEIWSYQLDHEKRSEPIPLLQGFMETIRQYPELVRKAEIKVENTNGAILLISGEDDQMWPSSLFSERVIDRLERMKFDKPYSHLKYPGVGHSMPKPYYPNPLFDVEHPVAKAVFTMGGTPDANNKAGVDSWIRSLDFLEDNL